MLQLSSRENTVDCIFCDKARKMHNYKVVPIIKTASEILIEKIVTNAAALNDTQMKQKIEVARLQDFIYYHNSCKLNYFKAHILAQTTQKTEWHAIREIHNLVDNEIYSLITKDTIGNKHCFSLNYLVEYAKNALYKLGIENYESYESTLTNSYLLDKIKKNVTMKYK